MVNVLKKGMKKGDVFRDGEFCFEIVSVNNDESYVSRRISEEEAEEKAKAAEAPAPETGNVPKTLREELGEKTVPELKELADNMELELKGKMSKAEIVEAVAKKIEGDEEEESKKAAEAPAPDGPAQQSAQSSGDMILTGAKAEDEKTGDAQV